MTQGLIIKIVTLVVAILIIIKYLSPALMKIDSPWGAILVALVWLGVLWYVLSGQIKLP